MIIPLKTTSNGFSLPVYGMGTWQMGGRTERDMSNDDAADVRAMRMAIDKGITHFDTAEIYAAGHSEELLAEATQGTDRSSLFLVSKVARANLAPENVHAAIAGSLDRLRTDYLDMYLVHGWNALVPIDETMDAMSSLVDKGLTKYIGVCNYTAERLQKAQEVCRHKLVTNQVHYNIQMREIEKLGVLSFCQANDILITAWGPTDKGALNTEASLIRDLAAKYGKTPMQIGINWLTSQPSVVTIGKTTNPAHMDENLGAIGWTMEPEDIELIRINMPNQTFRSERVPLDHE